MSCDQGFQDSQYKVVVNPEQSCGTFSAAGAHLVPVADRPSFSPRGAIRTARPAHTSGYPGTAPAVPAEQGWSLSLATELHAPTDEPWPLFVRVLMACGFEAFHDATAKTVTLVPALAQSLTSAPDYGSVVTGAVAPFPLSVQMLMRGASTISVAGATFAASLVLERGKPAVLRLEGQGQKAGGVYEANYIGDNTAFNGVGSTDLIDIPLVFLGADLELEDAGYTGSTDLPLGVESMEINFNQTMPDGPNPRSAGGFAPVLPAHTEPATVQMRFDQTKYNLAQVHGKLESQETVEAMVALKNAAGAEVKIEFASLQYSGVGIVDRDGVRAYDATLEAVNAAGTDSDYIKITYTYVTS